MCRYLLLFPLVFSFPSAYFFRFHGSRQDDMCPLQAAAQTLPQSSPLEGSSERYGCGLFGPLHSACGCALERGKTVNFDGNAHAPESQATLRPDGRCRLLSQIPARLVQVSPSYHRPPPEGRQVRVHAGHGGHRVRDSRGTHHSTYFGFTRWGHRSQWLPPLPRALRRLYRLFWASSSNRRCLTAQSDPSPTLVNLPSIPRGAGTGLARKLATLSVPSNDYETTFGARSFAPFRITRRSRAPAK